MGATPRRAPRGSRAPQVNALQAATQGAGTGAHSAQQESKMAGHGAGWAWSARNRAANSQGLR